MAASETSCHHSPVFYASGTDVCGMSLPSEAIYSSLIRLRSGASGGYPFSSAACRIPFVVQGLNIKILADSSVSLPVDDGLFPPALARPFPGKQPPLRVGSPVRGLLPGTGSGSIILRHFQPESLTSPVLVLPEGGRRHALQEAILFYPLTHHTLLLRFRPSAPAPRGVPLFWLSAPGPLPVAPARTVLPPP